MAPTLGTGGVVALAIVTRAEYEQILLLRDTCA